MVQFADGNTVVTPQQGTPGNPLDYEDCDPAIGGQACDKELVFAAAEDLSTLGGTYRSQLLGNAGFIKVDYSLFPRHDLSARLITSRFNRQ